MKRQLIAAMVVVSASLFVVGITLAAQDRFTLKAPNGIAFSEFEGDKWQVIASAVADNAAGCGSSRTRCIKSIVGNAVAIKAYKDGHSGQRPARSRRRRCSPRSSGTRITWSRRRMV